VSSTGARVAGLDGCRAGWVLATATVDPRALPAELRLTDVEIDVVPRVADVVERARTGSLAALGVDMPIGLPERGQRAADQAARRRLGPRRSSVFPTPLRCALDAVDYADALARSKAADGRGLSKQAFNLLPAMAEVDAALTADLQDRVFECHPETVFARLNQGPVLTRKHDAEGLVERRELLDPWLADSIDSVGRPPSGAKVDDVLDALAVALTAARLTIGDVEHLGDGALDGRGLRMEIVV
jgi:predicted RNase H-like nuclease